MKFYTYIFLFFFSYTFAQKGLIQYGYIEALGIGNAKGTDSNAFMVFNKEQSYFVTAKDSLENAFNKSVSKTFENETGGGAIYNGLKVSKEGDQVVYHIAKKTMWSNILYGEQIYVKELLPVIDWTIGKESKKIGAFNCVKASTTFRGRKYIAWFTPDIPVPFGPWKLQGLPGLILEAQDLNKNVFWYFKNLQYPSKTNEIVRYMTIPKKMNWLSYQEFKKVQQDEIQMRDDKNKIIKKEHPGIIFNLPTLTEMFLECEK